MSRVLKSAITGLIVASAVIIICSILNINRVYAEYTDNKAQAYLDSSNFSVTLPTSLPIHVDANGNTIESSDCNVIH